MPAPDYDSLRTDHVNVADPADAAAEPLDADDINALAEAAKDLNTRQLSVESAQAEGFAGEPDVDATSVRRDGYVLFYNAATDKIEGILPVPNVLTVKGDSIGFDGSTILREPVGTNGQAQLADSAAATGKSWQTVALKSYVDALLAANDAMVFKGAIDASSNPNYPAADAGHVYKISVAGKIGGASGTNVEVGDTILCAVDSSSAGTQAAVGANWTVVQANLDGAVIGPASAVSGDLATFSGAGGKLIQDSGLARDTDTALAANSDVKIPSQKAVKAYVDAEAVLRAAADLVVGVNTQTADYTAVLGDAGKVIRMNSASARVGTIPPNSSVAYPLNTVLGFRRVGAGSFTVTPGSGVTIPNRVQAAGTASRTIANQYGEATAHQVATDVWELVGDIA